MRYFTLLSHEDLGFWSSFCVCVCVCALWCCGPSGHGQTWLWIQSQQIRMRWRGKLLFSPSFNSSLLVCFASLICSTSSLWVFVCVCARMRASTCEHLCAQTLEHLCVCVRAVLFEVSQSVIILYWSVIENNSPIDCLWHMFSSWGCGRHHD